MPFSWKLRSKLRCLRACSLANVVWHAHVMDFDQTQAIYDYEEDEEEQVEDEKANPKKKEVCL